MQVNEDYSISRVYLKTHFHIKDYFTFSKWLFLNRYLKIKIVIHIFKQNIPVNLRNKLLRSSTKMRLHKICMPLPYPTLPLKKKANSFFIVF